MLTPNGKTFLFNNLRSLTKNFDKFISSYLSPVHASITAIGFNETHLTADTEPTYQIPGFTLFTTNNSSNTGGVALYLREALHGNIIPDLSMCRPYCESVFVEYPINNNEYRTIGVIYRRETDIRDFMTELTRILEHPKVNNKNCLIMGDFNIDLIDYGKRTLVTDLVELMADHSFFSCINKPTRVTNHSATIIDHIWSNDIVSQRKNGILLTDTSDHFSPFTINYDRSFLPGKPKTSTIQFRDYKNEPDPDIVREMHRLCINTALGDNVEQAYDTLSNTLKTVHDYYYPIKTKTIKQKDINKPWINQDLKVLIKEKHKLYSKFIRKPISFGDQYRTFRNRLNTSIKLAKDDYYKKKLEEAQGNSKATWKILNSILKCKQSKKTYINKLIVNDVEITDQKEIANNLNSFFANIGESLSNDLPKTDADPLIYMRGNYPVLREFAPTSLEEVKNIINKMKKNSAGPDGIPLKLLKNTINMTAPLICDFINLSMDKAVYPIDLKKARVTPIFKGGDATDMGNYRPISNLNTINKIFEKIIYTRLLEHIDENNILTNCQFGFRKNLSTQSALLSLLDKITTSLSSKQVGVALFMDFKKAFDSIDHNILLKKLQFYGFHGKIYQWIKSYLSARSQYIKVGEAESTYQSIKFGVPQGSILGPLLFLLFINDLPNCSDLIFFCLFADDSNLFLNAPDFRSLQILLKNELPKVSNWILINKLSLNLSKTHYLLFHRVRQTQALEVTLCNKRIPIERSSKMLGVFIDDKLSWKDHLSHVTKKLSSAIGIINKLKQSLNFEAKKSVYYSLVYPYLQYCNLVWGNAAQTNLRPIHLKQKKVIRIINNADYIEPTNNLFKNNKIIKFPDIYKLEAQKFVNQQLQIQNPVIRFSRANDVHNYQTRGNRNLRPPQPTTEVERRFIRFSGCQLYNTLPDDIKRIQNKNTLKINLKKLILRGY